MFLWSDWFSWLSAAGLREFLSCSAVIQLRSYLFMRRFGFSVKFNFRPGIEQKENYFGSSVVIYKRVTSQNGTILTLIWSNVSCIFTNWPAKKTHEFFNGQSEQRIFWCQCIPPLKICRCCVQYERERKTNFQLRRLPMFFVSNNHSILFGKYLLSLNNGCSLSPLHKIISINLLLAAADAVSILFSSLRVRLRKCG